MIDMSNDIIYNGQLKDGHGTALTGNPDAQELKAYLAKTYPSLQSEPKDLIYPVMLNVHGYSHIEHHSKSVFNSYNVAATLDEVMRKLKTYSRATSKNIGIATPYRAQVRAYKRVLTSAHHQFPGVNLLPSEMTVVLYDATEHPRGEGLGVGTAEHWQGDELDHIFVDLVRAANDAAVLGFVSNYKRLNMMITRQKQGMWVVGDELCVLTLAQQAERNTPIDTVLDEPLPETGKKSSEDRKNAAIIAMFNRMREKGRVVNVSREA